MSSARVHYTHVVTALPALHDSLLEIVSAINRPERDEVLLKKAGLSLERALFPLMVYIGRLGPIGVVDLASRVGRDYTTVSRQVARLEQLGLVDRRPNAEDRRVREAVSTAKGRQLTKAVDAARAELAVALFKQWGRQDFDDLCRLLQMLAVDLNRLPDL